MTQQATTAALPPLTAEEVMAIRRKANMTQDELAVYLGLRHRSQVRHLESGRTLATGPKAVLLRKLAKETSRKKPG